MLDYGGTNNMLKQLMSPFSHMVKLSSLFCLFPSVAAAALTPAGSQASDPIRAQQPTTVAGYIIAFLYTPASPKTLYTTSCKTSLAYSALAVCSSP